MAQQELLTNQVLDDFQNETNYDLQKYINNYVYFLENDYPAIIDFFKGTTDIPDAEAFSHLDILLNEISNVFSVVEQNTDSLQDYRYWVLLDQLEEINRNLHSIDNASRWLRSARTQDSYQQDAQITVTNKQGQTLQEFHLNQLGSDDYLNDWYQTAIDNNLREEDYTSGEPTELKVTFRNNLNLDIQSVIDNIDSAKKTYGLDFDKKIQFENNDLKILDHDSTLAQCTAILPIIRKGDILQFAELGLDSSLLGSNRNQVAFPILFRQLFTTFQIDDSLKSFKITDINFDQDALFISYEVETRAGEVIQQTANLI